MSCKITGHTDKDIPALARDAWDQACRKIDQLLAVGGIEQGGADYPTTLAIHPRDTLKAKWHLASWSSSPFPDISEAAARSRRAHLLLVAQVGAAEVLPQILQFFEDGKQLGSARGKALTSIVGLDASRSTDRPTAVSGPLSDEKLNHELEQYLALR